MAHTAKKHLVRVLAGDRGQASDSATVRIAAEALELQVEGVGSIPLPVRPTDVKKLVAVA